MAVVDIDADVSRLREALDRIAAQAGMYGRKIADTFNRGIAPLAEARGQLGRFGEVAKSLNANPVISQVESLSSLLIPLGGNVSRVGMTFATAARPVAVMASIMGEMPPALVATATAAGSVAVGVGAMGLAISIAGNQAVEAAGRVTELVEELEKSAKGGSLEARHELERYGEQVLAVKALEQLHADTQKEQNRLLLAGADATAKQAKGWENLKFSMNESWEAAKANLGINSFLMWMGKEDVENTKARAEFIDILTQSTENLNITKEASAELEKKGREQADADAARREKELEQEKKRLELKKALLANEIALRATSIDLPDPLPIVADESAVSFSTPAAFNFQTQADQTDAAAMKLVADQEAAAGAFSAAMGQIVSESASGMVAIVGAATENTIAMYGEMQAAGEHLTRDEQARYRAALTARKIAAVSEILVNAGVAYAAMTAGLAASLGPGAPAAPAIAAAIVGTSVIAPLAGVLGESIPWISPSGASGGAYGGRGGGGGDDGGGGGLFAPGGPIYDLVYPDGDGKGGGGTQAPGGGGGSSNRSARSGGNSQAIVSIDPRTRNLRIEDAVPGKSWGRHI